VIQVDDDHVLCWVELQPGERAKTALPLGWFDGAPKSGQHFRWAHSGLLGSVSLDATEDRPFPDPKLEAECLAAFDRGECATLQQAIDELRVRAEVRPARPGGWDDAKSYRRCELIDKEEQGVILPGEKTELDELQIEYIRTGRDADIRAARIHVQRQEAGECMAAVRATREPPWFLWRRALVDLLIMVIAVVLSAWLIVSVAGGTG
jgi:hypothetical protein